MEYRIIFVVFFCLLMFYLAYKNSGSDAKNMINFKHYSAEVQKAIRKDDDLKKIAPDDKSVLTLLISNLIINLILFGFFGFIFKKQLTFTGYMDAFIFFLVAGELVNLFDLLVIRLLWWPNTKRIRFSILPKKEYYQDRKKHINGFLMNIPVYIVVALLVAVFVR